MKSIILSCSVIIIFFTSMTLAEESIIKSDEQVIFFPTIGVPLGDNNKSWEFKIHGWIFEPEVGSISRKVLTNALCNSLSLLQEECDRDIFKERAIYFLADNERGKTIRVKLGEHSIASEKSEKDGHFFATFKLNDSEFLKLGNEVPQNWLKINTLPRSDGDSIFEGNVLPLFENGLSVISDIDDTIKVSNVTDKKELLNNTFTRPFKAVSGMVQLYQSLAKNGASFHYITASPWQLYPSLAKFIDEFQFPKGTFHMKEFRWKDSRFFDLFLSPEKYKTPIIESFLNSFPRRRFILIGDSGEKDPEIYGNIARGFPAHDIKIYIRDINVAPMTEARIEAAFTGIKKENWQILTEH